MQTEVSLNNYFITMYCLYFLLIVKLLRYKDFWCFSAIFCNISAKNIIRQIFVKKIKLKKNGTNTFKKKYIYTTLSGKFQNQIVERGKLDVLQHTYTFLYDCLISWLGTHTSIKSGGVKQVYWPKHMYNYTDNWQASKTIIRAKVEVLHWHWHDNGKNREQYSDRYSDPPSLRIKQFTIKKQLVTTNPITFEANKSLKQTSADRYIVK